MKLGGYCLTVPAYQHADASALIADMLEQPADYGESHVNRVWAVTLMMMAATIPFAVAGALLDRDNWTAWAWVSEMWLGTPAVPQGRSEYYLSKQH
ncbi:MAG: hypothetical protein ABL909_01880 [Sphingopyxis sp.]